MASKNELESENASLKIRIKELEGTLSGESSVPSTSDRTFDVLTQEIEDLRTVITIDKTRIKKLEGDLVESADNLFYAMNELAKARHTLTPQQQPDGEQLTAKEISRGLLYREIDESVLFVRI